jgi:hypothetical protein
VAVVSPPSQAAIVVSSRLANLEAVITEGLGTFVAVGRALTEIRDAELYRATHSSFEAYCQERWGFKKSRAYQLISAAGVVENVHSCGNAPTNEAHARELGKVNLDQQEEVWVEVLQTAPSGVVTAKHVADVVAKRLPPPKQGEADPCVPGESDLLETALGSSIAALTTLRRAARGFDAARSRRIAEHLHVAFVALLADMESQVGSADD